MPDLYAYANLLAAEKRRRPGDDVMSILLAQDDSDGQLSVAEFENMFWLFAVAGNETLRNGLPGACIALLEHPDAQEELRNDPGPLPTTAVDEMLRWWTPVMTFRRTATKPSSPHRTASISGACPTRIWCSATARISVLALTWPAPPASATRASRPTSDPTSSAA
jgi:cytochrome P450